MSRTDLALPAAGFLAQINSIPGAKISQYTAEFDPENRPTLRAYVDSSDGPNALIEAFGMVLTNMVITCESHNHTYGSGYIHRSIVITVTGDFFGAKTKTSLHCDHELGAILGVSDDDGPVEITAQQWIDAHKHLKAVAEVTA